MTNLAKYIKQSGGEVGGNMKYFKSKGGLCLYIIAAIIAFAVFRGFRSFIKGKGSCGDCDCNCSVKDEMHKTVK